MSNVSPKPTQGTPNEVPVLNDERDLTLAKSIIEGYLANKPDNPEPPESILSPISLSSESPKNIEVQNPVPMLPVNNHLIYAMLIEGIVLNTLKSAFDEKWVGSGNMEISNSPINIFLAQHLPKILKGLDYKTLPFSVSSLMQRMLETQNVKTAKKTSHFTDPNNNHPDFMLTNTELPGRQIGKNIIETRIKEKLIHTVHPGILSFFYNISYTTGIADTGEVDISIFIYPNGTRKLEATFYVKSSYEFNIPGAVSYLSLTNGDNITVINPDTPGHTLIIEQSGDKTIAKWSLED